MIHVNVNWVLHRIHRIVSTPKLSSEVRVYHYLLHHYSECSIHYHDVIINFHTCASGCFNISNQFLASTSINCASEENDKTHSI